MATSYTDLQIYRQCPRLFGFGKLGYEPVTRPEPMTTGQLVHAGLAAHFKGQDWRPVIQNAVAETIEMIDKNITDRAKEELAYKSIITASKRAVPLAERYIAHWAKDYEPIFVEQEFEMDGVVCHMDLVAEYQRQPVIVDYKTSYHPDERWYDISGQLDLYAHIETAYHGKVNLIIYDVISEEGIFRHMRPPRLEAGKRLFLAVQALNSLITRVKPHTEKREEISNLLNWPPQVWEPFLSDPHPNYTCPSRCSFFHPCWLLETGSWEDCRDYLESNFLREDK